MPNKKISIFLAILILLIFALPFAFIAYSADSPAPAAKPKLEIDYPSLPPFATNPPTTLFGNTVLSNYIIYVFGFLIVVSAIIAVVMIAIGGVEYIYSAGSPEKMKSGANKITTSVLGLIILGCSYVILVTINPNLVKIGDPTIKPLTSGSLGPGVWACKERMDFNYLWDEGKLLSKDLDTAAAAGDKNSRASQYDMLKPRIDKYNTAKSLVSDKCYNVSRSGATQKGFEDQISYIYLVPEEGKTEYGVIIYDELIQKSRARVIYGNGVNNLPAKDKPVEWPVDGKKPAFMRPFFLIYDSPTDLIATLYQLPHKNRGASDAKKIECSTRGQTEDWCDLSGLIPSPNPTPDPTPNPTPDPTPYTSLDSKKSLAGLEDNSGGCPEGTCCGKDNYVCFPGSFYTCSYSNCKTDNGCPLGQCPSSVGGTDCSRAHCNNFCVTGQCTDVTGYNCSAAHCDNPCLSGQCPDPNDPTNLYSCNASNCPGYTPTPDPNNPNPSPTPDPNNPNSSSSASGPPKISSVEFKGEQFFVFFKDDVSDWDVNAILDVVGPSDENNLSSGAYIMGDWNEECKERRAEEPNSKSYYPCAKKAILVNAHFL